jgi:hypothetical protein
MDDRQPSLGLPFRHHPDLANTTNPKDDHHHRDAAALSRATTELTAQNEAGQTIH